MIHKATRKDLPDILNLQKIAFEEVALLLDNYNLPPLQQTLEELNKEFEISVVLKYLSEDNKIVGSVRAFVDVDNVCHVGKLVVDPAYQNQGIGKMLLNEIEKEFPSCRKFSLFTGEITPNTRHLYENQGYHIVDRKEADGVSMLFMEKRT